MGEGPKHNRREWRKVHPWRQRSSASRLTWAAAAVGLSIGSGSSKVEIEQTLTQLDQIRSDQKRRDCLSSSNPTRAVHLPARTSSHAHTHITLHHRRQHTPVCTIYRWAPTGIADLTLPSVISWLASQAYPSQHPTPATVNCRCHCHCRTHQTTLPRTSACPQRSLCHLLASHRIRPARGAIYLLSIRHTLT